MQEFANPLASGGFFGREQVGNSTFTITAIPEPSTYVAARGLHSFLRQRQRPGRRGDQAPTGVKHG